MYIISKDREYLAGYTKKIKCRFERGELIFMKKIIALLLTVIFILVNPVFAFADIRSTVVDPYLTNLLGSLYSTPSEWSKDDDSRAMLALSLYLDVSVANNRIQDTVYVESLIKDA